MRVRVSVWLCAAALARIRSSDGNPLSDVAAADTYLRIEVGGTDQVPVLPIKLGCQDRP
jgi:hypothetical protein